MLMGRSFWMRVVIVMAALAGGASGPAGSAAPAATDGAGKATRPGTAPPDWRAMATPADRQRIRTWRDSWTKALAEVAAAGKSPRLAPLGTLMQADTALADPMPPPGDYVCRVYKLGTRAPGAASVIAVPPAACRIAREQDVLSFAKLSGAQKPVGFLLQGDDRRLIFLGTMMLGDERRALDYGSDPERDMAGAFERVGPRRWRLVLPFPHWESTLEVIELTPKA